MRVDRIEALDTLPVKERELLTTARDPERSLRSGHGRPLRLPDDAELVVYRVDDGTALVAPRTPTVRVGVEVVCVGASAAVQLVGISEGGDTDKVDLHVAEGLRPAHFPPHR
jgi:hypothetical protein